MLRAAALEAEGVVPEPTPVVYVDEYADFAVVYRVRVWLTDWGTKPRVRDAVMRRVWYRLRRAGMVIPFPIRDVNVRPVPPDAANQSRSQRQAEVQALLAPLPLLAPLTADQIAALAAASELHRYSAGEILVRQGEAGDSLFVVRTGQVRVDVDHGDGQAITVARRGPRDFFGEMSLLTGEARSATVVAETECDVVVVPKGAVAGLLLTDPGVVEALSKVLAARVTERDARLAEASASEMENDRELQASLMARIRGFFGVIVAFDVPFAGREPGPYHSSAASWGRYSLVSSASSPRMPKMASISRRAFSWVSPLVDCMTASRPSTASR